jgi:hypothetical protein
MLRAELEDLGYAPRVDEIVGIDHPSHSAKATAVDGCLLSGPLTSFEP